jgi:hypothetical protein
MVIRNEPAPRITQNCVPTTALGRERRLRMLARSPLTPQLRTPLPYTPGSDGAGVVEAVGEVADSIRQNNRMQLAFFFRELFRFTGLVR